MRISLLALTALSLPLAAEVDFVGQVQPLLRSRCIGCHGPAMQQSGFRVDDREAALKGGYSGKVIEPGKASESALIHRVAGTNGVAVMPPAGKKLTPDEVAILRTWINEGARWPDSAAKPKGAAARPLPWSFQPLRQPAVPAGGLHPVDAFVRARLEKERIQPSPEAPRATLLRRVSLDLTGLPPTPTQLAAFLADSRPGAYERAVDQLLSSPHYGEKWARPWLDLARYADSDGYEKDWVRPHAWRWRQWVIEALNADLPFDQFTIEQIAGDLLPNAGVAQKVATGFHRNTLTNREGGIDNEQFRFEAVADRSVTVASGWLGLTVGCAQCHDHKFDPISQKDFYTLMAFFDNAEEEDIDAPMPGEREPWEAKRAEYQAKRTALLSEYNVAALQADWEQNMLQAFREPGKRTDWDLAWDCLLKLTETGDGAKIIKKPAESRTARERDILVDHFVRNYHFAIGQKKWKELKFDELDKKLRELKESYPRLSQAQTISETEGERRKSYLRVRGDYKTLGIPVDADVPGALGSLGKKDATRLDLARWLVSRDNPLTARVTVNRVWQEYFGRGLVETSEDFGVQGAKPTHPELLDWLATEFMSGGWSMKTLHRLIVTSATYRQSSTGREDLESIDPNNLLLARQSRLRLPAELIRDTALAVSGLLDDRVGGRSVRPPQPKGVTELGYGGGTKWAESTGGDRYRRGLYIHFQRTTPYPLLQNFDAPKGTVTQCRRGRSNTPLQALNLLNDPVFMEAAEALARRVESADFRTSLQKAYLLTLSREPREDEAARLEAYLKTPDATWTGLASVLLNLDEFIVRE
jgi:mono/diheme cytochrome c family protein